MRGPWILSLLYSALIVSPPGQYVVVAMLFFTAAFGATTPLQMFLPFLILGGVSVVAVFNVEPPGKKTSYALQVLAMWVLATAATFVAYGAVDRAWNYGRTEPAISAPEPLRVPPDPKDR
jgi:hypothetical protein